MVVERRWVWRLVLSLTAQVGLGHLSAAAASYYINCGGQHVSHSITSVLGEIRTQTSTTTVPTRYHAGVDVSDYCTDGVQVLAIEAGRVSTPVTPGCVTTYCRRVTSSSGLHAFEYVDIQSTLADGATVQIGDVIGTIANVAEGPHLHLNEIQGLGLVNCENGGTNCFRINPQRENAMIFVDNDIPTFQTFTVGDVADQEIILVRYSGTGPKGGQTPTAYTFMDDTFFVKDYVDVLTAVHNVGTEFRKGVYLVDEAPIGANQSCNALNINPRPNIYFNTLFDQATDPQDILTTYFKQFSNANGVIATDWQINNNSRQQTQPSNWNTNTYPEGARQICVSATSYPRGQTRSLGVNVVIDRTPPTITFTDINDVPFSYATSSTTIKVVGTDTVADSGIYTITLSSSGGTPQTSTNTSVTQSYTATFSGLTDGQYTATVVDLAGNSAQASFQVISQGLSEPDLKDALGNSVSNSTVQSVAPVVISTGVCITSMTVTNSLGATVGAASYSCSTNAAFGPFANLAVDTYTFIVQDVVGHTASRDLVVNSTIPVISLAGNSQYSQTNSFNMTDLPFAQIKAWGTASVDCNKLTFTANGVAGTCSGSDCPPGIGQCMLVAFPPPPAKIDITLTYNDASTMTMPTGGNIYIGYNTPGNFGTLAWTLQIGKDPFSGGTSLTGVATIPQMALQQTAAGSCQAFGVTVPISGTSFGCWILTRIQELALKVYAGAIKVVAATPINITHSDAVFKSTGTVTFTFPSTQGPVSVDTTTLSIYGWTGTTWSSASVTGQSISISGSSITIRGWITATGVYAPLFDAHDSSAPATTYYVQGSTSVFDGTVYVSTSAYAVLSATDPVVNNINAEVATTYYRLDATTSSAAYSVYTSSVPLAIGPHILQWYSVDWQGNQEVVKTSTFVVTAGTGFKTSQSLSASGRFLAGFLDSGYRAEIESRAENSYTLLASSPNLGNLLNVTNIGTIGLAGVQNPQAILDIQGQAASGEIALQLRSGNSATTLTSSQLAFGYNGDASMSHAIKTGHDVSYPGNRMDFFVWNPGAGSTTTVANLDVASLQVSTASASGGSLHIHPAIEIADAEVEVSNGVGMGQGTVIRANSVIGSSLETKSDVNYFNEEAERQALRDVLALKPARFRYKRKDSGGRLIEDPKAPQISGLILEDSPESIRSGSAVALTERITNLEMALKQAIKKTASLKKRLRELEAQP
ncbi:MAG: hypothetical protein HY078_06240 [Elusimicrobia bacterium]|nr:hypothetical protein [Elusimicrobiota bacterium]